MSACDQRLLSRACVSAEEYQRIASRARELEDALDDALARRDRAEETSLVAKAYADAAHARAEKAEAELEALRGAS